MGRTRVLLGPWGSAASSLGSKSAGGVKTRWKMAPKARPAAKRASSPRILAAATIFIDDVIFAMLVVDAIFIRSCFSEAMVRAYLGARTLVVRSIRADMVKGRRRHESGPN